MLAAVRQWGCRGFVYFSSVSIYGKITVPVVDGRLALGTWQSVCLVDTNGDTPVRTVRLSFLPG